LLVTTGYPRRITSNSRHLVLLDATHITKKKNNFEITLKKKYLRRFGIWSIPMHEVESHKS